MGVIETVDIAKKHRMQLEELLESLNSAENQVHIIDLFRLFSFLNKIYGSSYVKFCRVCHISGNINVASPRWIFFSSALRLLLHS